MTAVAVRRSTADAMRVVPTGTANLEAVVAGFGRLDIPCETISTSEEILEAPRVVLPGVGSFEAGMEALRRTGWDRAVKERIERDLPTLAICLGLQLLCESSDEAPGVAGLGCVGGAVGRFGDAVRVPQLGWNDVSAPTGARFLEDGVAYFANSYRLAGEPAGWTCATASYDGEFVAALERGNVLACQFHPELSGSWGLDLLRRWMEASC